MTDVLPVDVRRVEQVDDLETDIRRAEALAKMLDAQFEVAGIKFGLDAIIGLAVPVVGDLVTTAMGCYPVAIARKHNLGRVVVGRMLLNLGVDLAIGAVPIVGDLFDVWRKANLKNIAVLKAAAAKRRGATTLLERDPAALSK
ncbi:MAG TPA: DUF4112 domain-containing protein [Tepidisphaeraceae bacterium]